jgi:hypothetical protein
MTKGLAFKGSDTSRTSEVRNLPTAVIQLEIDRQSVDYEPDDTSGFQD